MLLPSAITRCKMFPAEFSEIRSSVLSGDHDITPAVGVTLPVIDAALEPSAFATMTSVPSE